MLLPLAYIYSVHVFNPHVHVQRSFIVVSLCLFVCVCVCVCVCLLVHPSIGFVVDN